MVYFEESVERFAVYFVTEMEALKQKEEEPYNKMIDEEMKRLEEFWMKEFDLEEEESISKFTESEKCKKDTQERFKSPRKMVSPSKSSLVSKKFEDLIKEVACPKGKKCNFHRFHTGHKLIIFNCQHAKNFTIRRDVQRAIIEGTLKNMDILPSNKPKSKKKFKKSFSSNSCKVPRNVSVWQYVENALISKNLS